MPRRCRQAWARHARRSPARSPTRSRSKMWSAWSRPPRGSSFRSTRWVSGTPPSPTTHSRSSRARALRAAWDRANARFGVPTTHRSSGPAPILCRRASTTRPPSSIAATPAIGRSSISAFDRRWCWVWPAVHGISASSGSFTGRRARIRGSRRARCNPSSTSPRSPSSTASSRASVKAAAEARGPGSVAADPGRCPRRASRVRPGLRGHPERHCPRRADARPRQLGRQGHQVPRLVRRQGVELARVPSQDGLRGGQPAVGVLHRARVHPAAGRLRARSVLEPTDPGDRVPRIPARTR